MLKSKRLWLNVVAGALYAGKFFGFDVPEPDPTIVATLNLILQFLRTKYGI